MKNAVFAGRLMVALGALLFTGCAVIPHVGVIYTEAQHPMRWDPPDNQVYLQGKEYQVMGQVRGEATVENYAGFVAMGDYGITTAYRNALRNAGGADLLVDVHVDQQTMRVLGFYIKATTIVTGTAVKILGSSGASAPSSSPPTAAAPSSGAQPGASSQPPAAGGASGSPSGGSGGGEEENPWWGK